MEAYGGVDVLIRIFLTSALAAGEWSASRRFTPGERALGARWIGGWAGSDPFVVQPVVSRSIDYAVPALEVFSVLFVSFAIKALPAINSH
jgi:hypothetical protein